MDPIQFKSAREINAACRNAAFANGPSVRVRIQDEHGTQDLQISRAKSDRHGGLKVYLVSSNKWVDCAWSDVSTRK